MIRWRRKTDGFEWHKHVRTTIRIRREHRRQRIEEARLLALEGMKEAGRAGVAVGSSWLSFVDRLVRSAAYSLQSGVRRLIDSIPAAWEQSPLLRVEGVSGCVEDHLPLSRDGCLRPASDIESNRPNRRSRTVGIWRNAGHVSPKGMRSHPEPGRTAAAGARGRGCDRGCVGAARLSWLLG